MVQFSKQQEVAMRSGRYLVNEQRDETEERIDPGQGIGEKHGHTSTGKWI